MIYLNWVIGVFTVLLFVFLHQRSVSFLATIIYHWTRWLAVSFGIPYFLLELQWSTRPYWVLVLSCFLLWFLLETFYNWLIIGVVSKGEVPIFPDYDANETGAEWPAQRRFIGLREWIRENGFRRSQAVKAEFNEEYVLRVSIYENEPETIRLHILFLPHRSKDVAVCFSIASQNREGRRLVTENLFLPFGGFYPDNWSVERRTWTRSLPRLLKRHLKRMESFSETLVPWEENPLHDLKNQKRILEQINTQRGILFPRHLQEEFGRFTWEGRYRFWKEIWLLNYFGHTIVG